MTIFSSKIKRGAAIAACVLAPNLCALAQPAAAPPAAATRVFTLGTQGGPISNANRSQPSNAVVVGDRIYLVDAGNGVARQLRQAGLDYRRVGNIFITHNHDDHNADWGTLMGLQWSTGRRSPTHVYGPKGTESMREGFLRYFQYNAEIRASDPGYSVPPEAIFKAHDITGNGVVYQDDLVKVSAVEVCHYHFSIANMQTSSPHKAYAFRFETPDKVIVFSGDTGACAALTDFARGADLLIHEVVSLPLMADTLRKLFDSMPEKPPAGMFEGLMRHMAEDHTLPEDIGQLAKAAGVKKVVLSHFVPGGDKDPDSAYLDGVKKYFDGPVVAAKDLMEF